MDKYSKLAKNTGIFFIANFGSKLLTFFLVRFYTELLTAEEYGIIDLLNTTASLAYPMVTLCITEAVLRFSIDEAANRGKILTNGLAVGIVGNVVFTLTIPAFLQIPTFSENVMWIYLLAFTNSLNAITVHFSRGIGKSKLFAAAGVVQTALQIALNVLFLMIFSWGIKGYLVASVLSNLLTTLTVFVAGRLYIYIDKKVDRKYLKTMLVYSLPLIPNAMFWWIMQSSNRYIITYFLTTTENGLYAVANKIPTLITTVSSIFFQAWQISSVEESRSTEKSQFYTNVFFGLSTLLILATSFLMVILQPVYMLLTEESYYVGWTSVPFLLCATLYSCYSSFLGTNYVAMKKTKGVFITTVVGAAANILISVILTPIMGIEGTALATLISFAVTWITRVFGTRKYVQIQYPVQTFWIPSVLVLGQAVLLTFGVYSIWIQCIFFGAMVLLYMKEIIRFAKAGCRFISERRR